MPTDPARLQDALTRTAETHGPGLVGLVTEHGEPVFEGAGTSVRMGQSHSDHGGLPGYTTVALRTAGGRTIVLYQNGIDLHDVLTRDTPFVAAALAAG